MTATGEEDGEGNARVVRFLDSVEFSVLGTGGLGRQRRWKKCSGVASRTPSDALSHRPYSAFDIHNIFPSHVALTKEHRRHLVPRPKTEYALSVSLPHREAR